jgi:hypothetical protein
MNFFWAAVYSAYCCVYLGSGCKSMATIWELLGILQS